MLKIFATNVVISKGFDGAPALRFSENGESVRFRIGQKVYDTRAENNTRWVNLSVKAFGQVCERIKKMQLKDGSFVNFVGRYDEDTWTDQQTHEQKSMPVIILDEIEFASGGSKNKDNQKTGQQNDSAPQTGSSASAAPAAAHQTSGNFTGYEPFGGGSFFDMNG